MPPHTLPQMEIAERAIARLEMEGEEAQRLRKIYQNSAIGRRYSVLEDFAGACALFGEGYPAKVPGTAVRNEIYCREAPKLAAEAARAALNGEAITHVITISCTGMTAPGLEFLLIDELGLSRNVQRIGLNFMGCFGAFRGLAVASAIAKENARHRVLVVCTELCSLHFQADRAIDTIVSNALFADGAAAAVVGAEPRAEEEPLFRIARSHSLALEDSLDHMTWNPSDAGYVMRLSYEVPAQIREHIIGFLGDLAHPNLPLPEHAWAIHPGGKAILHAAAQRCGLSRDQLTASWEVLRDYGNMSSATFLFVLDRLLKEKQQSPWTVGIGFGPGLSLEGTLLENQCL